MTALRNADDKDLLFSCGLTCGLLQMIRSLIGRPCGAKSSIEPSLSRDILVWGAEVTSDGNHFMLSDSLEGLYTAVELIRSSDYNSNFRPNHDKCWNQNPLPIDSFLLRDDSHNLRCGELNSSEPLDYDRRQVPSEIRRDTRPVPLENLRCAAWFARPDDYEFQCESKTHVARSGWSVKYINNETV